MTGQVVTDVAGHGVVVTDYGIIRLSKATQEYMDFHADGWRDPKKTRGKRRERAKAAIARMEAAAMFIAAVRFNSDQALGEL